VPIVKNGTYTKSLIAYAELLIETFSKQELLSGKFKAVGLVHKDKGDDNKPRHVGHYWACYDPEINRQYPKPQTLVQYVFQGQGITDEGDEVYPTSEKIAEGILSLARMSKSEVVAPRRSYKNRYIIGLLDEHADIKRIYEEMLFAFAVKKISPNQKKWEEVWQDNFRKIAETIAGVCITNAEAKDFLAWSCELEGLNFSDPDKTKHNNIYHFFKDGKNVAIQVGSIHSIKGETHSATLVMETFWYKHNIEAIIPWLDGRKSGPGKVGSHQETRLKTQYVAMTRPTHLLCLAMKRDSLESENGELERSIQRFKDHGWCDVGIIE